MSREPALAKAGGTGKMLGWLVARGIDPHIPVWDKGKRSNGTFSRQDFAYDKERNVYICPKGKVLKTTDRLYEGKTFRYRASKFDCDRCSQKQRCCPKTPARYVPRDINEEGRFGVMEIQWANSPCRIRFNR